MIAKVDDVQKERAYVADEHKGLLQRLKDDLKVFPTQLDAWAFAAAYAMNKHEAKEQPPTPRRKEQLPELRVLEAELITVLLESDNYLASTSGWEIITEARAATQRLSDWASLGLSLLSVEWEGRGREQIRRMILQNVSSSLPT